MSRGSRTCARGRTCSSTGCSSTTHGSSFGSSIEPEPATHFHGYSGGFTGVGTSGPGTIPLPAWPRRSPAQHRGVPTVVAPHVAPRYEDGVAIVVKLWPPATAVGTVRMVT